MHIMQTFLKFWIEMKKMAQSIAFFVENRYLRVVFFMVLDLR